MQLCSVVEFYRPYGLSRLVWVLVWVWYGLKVTSVCARARSEQHLKHSKLIYKLIRSRSSG